MAPNTTVDMAPEQPRAPPDSSGPVGGHKAMQDEGPGAESHNCKQEVPDRRRGDPTSTDHGTMSDSEDPFCRICHDGGCTEDLLSPCECSGTLGTVHRGCLERWLTTSNSSHCELCHHQFALERLPKPFTEWLCSPSMRNQRRTLCGDAVCFLFITPLAGLSGWLCVQGALDLYYSNGMEAMGLLVLTLALFTIYVFWTAVSLRYHVHLFQTWKQTDQKVKLQIPEPERTAQSHTVFSLSFLRKDSSKETTV